MPEDLVDVVQTMVINDLVFKNNLRGWKFSESLWILVCLLCIFCVMTTGENFFKRFTTSFISISPLRCSWLT